MVLAKVSSAGAAWLTKQPFVESNEQTPAGFLSESAGLTGTTRLPGLGAPRAGSLATRLFNSFTNLTQWSFVAKLHLLGDVAGGLGYGAARLLFPHIPFLALAGQLFLDELVSGIYTGSLRGPTNRLTNISRDVGEGLSLRVALVLAMGALRLHPALRFATQIPLMSSLSYVTQNIGDWATGQKTTDFSWAGFGRHLENSAVMMTQGQLIGVGRRMVTQKVTDAAPSLKQTLAPHAKPIAAAAAVAGFCGVSYAVTKDVTNLWPLSLLGMVAAKDTKDSAPSQNHKRTVRYERGMLSLIYPVAPKHAVKLKKILKSLKGIEATPPKRTDGKPVNANTFKGQKIEFITNALKKRYIPEDNHRFGFHWETDSRRYRGSVVLDKNLDGQYVVEFRFHLLSLSGDQVVYPGQSIIDSVTRVWTKKLERLEGLSSGKSQRQPTKSLEPSKKRLATTRMPLPDLPDATREGASSFIGKPGVNWKDQFEAWWQDQGPDFDAGLFRSHLEEALGGNLSQATVDRFLTWIRAFPQTPSDHLQSTTILLHALAQVIGLSRDKIFYDINRASFPGLPKEITQGLNGEHMPVGPTMRGFYRQLGERWQGKTQAELEDDLLYRFVRGVATGLTKAPVFDTMVQVPGRDQRFEMDAGIKVLHRESLGSPDLYTGMALVAGVELARVQRFIFEQPVAGSKLPALTPILDRYGMEDAAFNLYPKGDGPIARQLADALAGTDEVGQKGRLTPSGFIWSRRRVQGLDSLALAQQTGVPRRFIQQVEKGSRDLPTTRYELTDKARQQTAQRFALLLKSLNSSSLEHHRIDPRAFKQALALHYPGLGDVAIEI